MHRYIVKVAQARGVVNKGLSTKFILTRLDLYEYMKEKGLVMFVCCVLAVLVRFSVMNKK